MDAYRWSQFSLLEQMGHIGSEVSRARVWQERNDTATSRKSMERAFEMIDLTLDDVRWRKRLKEICRFREVLAAQYVASAFYKVSLTELEQYCINFAAAFKAHKGGI